MERDGQKNENGLERGDSGSGDPNEFDQVWSQTVAGPSTSRGEIDPDGLDLPPLEAKVRTVAPSETDVSTPAADPVLRPDGNADLADESQLADRMPTLSGSSPLAQTASTPDQSGGVTENGLRSPGQSIQSPGPRNAFPSHLIPTGLPKQQPVPLAAGPTASAQGSTANIAVPGLPGSTDPGMPNELSRNEVNFLLTDKQQLKYIEKRTGIGAALAGNPMRRPSENPSLSSMPSAVGSRQPNGHGVGLAVPVQLGLRQGNRLGVEADVTRAESTAGERFAAGSSLFESTPVSSAPSGNSNLSLAGLRQTDAASVLEMVNRMADQMAARSQNRLSMTVRFETGGSVQIRMTSDQGEIRTVFLTDLPGLEVALRQQWFQFSQEAQDRGTRLSTMAFMSTDASPERDDSPSRNPDKSETLFDGERPSSSVSVPQTANPPTQSNRRTSATTYRGPGQLRAWV
jgi:hypothetical protein